MSTITVDIANKEISCVDLKPLVRPKLAVPYHLSLALRIIAPGLGWLFPEGLAEPTFRIWKWK